MSGGYRFAKSKVGGILKAVPDKEAGADYHGQKVAFSHVVDDLEYAALVVHGGMVQYIGSVLNPRKNKNRVKITPRGWS